MEQCNNKSVKMNKEPNRNLFHYVGIKCEASSEVALGTVTKVHTLHASDLYDDDTIKIKEEPRDDCEEFDDVIGGDEARGALIGCGESQSRFIVKHEESSSQNSLSQSSELQDASLAALCSVDQLPPVLPPSLPQNLPPGLPPNLPLGCQRETQPCGPVALTPSSSEPASKADVNTSSQLEKSTVDSTTVKKDYKIENKCPVCKQLFKLKCEVIKHISEVHCTEKLNCYICNQKFGNELLLRQHMTRVHNKPKYYNCTECALKFLRQCDLKSHIWKFHFDENSVGVVDKSSSSSSPAVIVQLPSTSQTISNPRNVVSKPLIGNCNFKTPQYKEIPILPAGKNQISVQNEVLLKVPAAVTPTQTTKFITQSVSIAPNSNTIVVKSADGSKALGTLTRIDNINNLVFPMLARNLEVSQQSRKPVVKVGRSKLLIKAQKNASQERILESWEQIKSNVCPLCRKPLASVYKLRFHFYTVHMKEVMLECAYCESLHACKSNLSKHVLKYHIRSDTVKRSVDKRNWSAEIFLEIYGQKETTTCPLCGLKCKRRQLVKTHILGYHMREQKFKCQYCSSTFGVKKELADHVIGHLIVNTSNENNSNFRKKIKIDFLPQIKNGTCPICQKQFKGFSQKYVKRHIWRVHLRKEKECKKYQCSVCFKVYLKPGSLTNHALKQHNVITVC